MAELIGLVGPSGSGKSTSLRNLDPDTTVIASIMGDKLPFTGAVKKFNKDKKNFFNLRADYAQVKQLMAKVHREWGHVKVLVIDNAGFLMANDNFEKSGEKGYGKFTEMATSMYNLLKFATALREDLKVVFTFHEEDGPENASGRAMKKIKTIGKMLDNQFSPNFLFRVMLFTHIEQEDQFSKPEYKFVTNIWGPYPAKSPMDMLEYPFIENDLNAVIQKLNEYELQEA